MARANNARLARRDEIPITEPASSINVYGGSLPRMTAEHNPIPPLVGGHYVLDLINTVEPRAVVAERVDRLAEPADLVTWAVRAGVIDDTEAAAVKAAWNASAVAGTQALAAS